MNCYYCDQIRTVAADYQGTPAVFDLGSAAPRCPKHWRYHCGQCGQPAHFMSLSFCPEQEAFFCADCADGRKEVEEPFWAWKYFFIYRSPWSGQWLPALDRLEYEKRRPFAGMAMAENAQEAVDKKLTLVRYPPRPPSWRSSDDVTDADVQANWNRNAEKWDALYDEDGDRNRRYQSDEPMLALLGDVKGKRLLDVGSGNGYLCRKLARQGAEMSGVELSDGFLNIALRYEEEDPLGITYYLASVAEMDFLPDEQFDKAVSNYVLMDVRDYQAALNHVYRLLRPGGIFVVVISHPCFSCGPGTWSVPAADSPRKEDLGALHVDAYFQRGPMYGVWGDLDPVLGFHRPLRDYWQAFTAVGFHVDGFEEPSITERGRRELPIYRIEHSMRIPYSCIFRLRKPA